MTGSVKSACSILLTSENKSRLSGQAFSFQMRGVRRPNGSEAEVQTADIDHQSQANLIVFVDLFVCYLRSGRRGLSASYGRDQRMSVSVIAPPRFEPTVRQVSELRRTIGDNIADLTRVGKGGSALPLPSLTRGNGGLAEKLFPSANSEFSLGLDLKSLAVVPSDERCCAQSARKSRIDADSPERASPSKLAVTPRRRCALIP
jgi:hypothetical protein